MTVKATGTVKLAAGTSARNGIFSNAADGDAGTLQVSARDLVLRRAPDSERMRAGPSLARSPSPSARFIAFGAPAVPVSPSRLNKGIGTRLLG